MTHQNPRHWAQLPWLPTLQLLAALTMGSDSVALSRSVPAWDSSITGSQLRPRLLQENRKSCDPQDEGIESKDFTRNASKTLVCSSQVLSHEAAEPGSWAPKRSPALPAPGRPFTKRVRDRLSFLFLLQRRPDILIAACSLL